MFLEQPLKYAFQKGKFSIYWSREDFQWKSGSINPMNHLFLDKF